MILEDVRIERVKLKDLPAMAARFIDGAKPGTFIPITKHRAQAMVHNPNSDPEDVAMLLATVGERCVGYFGVMAVMLQHEGELHKVHWLTTWAVAPDFIGTGLGSRLMEEALALDVDLAIVGSKPARRVSAKYGFDEVKSLDYVTIDFGLARRYNPISLLLRLIRNLLAKLDLRVDFGLLDHVIGSAFQFITWPIIKSFVVPQFDEVVEYGDFALDKTEKITDLLDGDSSHYFSDLLVLLPEPSSIESNEKARAASTRFYRDSHVVNWMLGNPWVVHPKNSSSRNLDYSFTDYRQGFEYFALRIWLPGWVTKAGVEKEFGYVVLQLSRIRGRKVLKVLDYRLAGSGQSKKPSEFAIALDFCRRFDAEILEGEFEGDLADFTGWKERLVTRKQRTLQVHPRAADSPLGRAWQQLEQTYVDGDTAFT